MAVNPVLSTNEFVIISNRDQETQTKPETSEEILESSDACIFGDRIKVYFYTQYTHTQCNVCRLCIFIWFLCSTKLCLHCLLCLLQ